MTEDLISELKEGFETIVRGSNEDEYAIYVAQAKSLGWAIKTYEEWLNS